MQSPGLDMKSWRQPATNHRFVQPHRANLSYYKPHRSAITIPPSHDQTSETDLQRSLYKPRAEAIIHIDMADPTSLALAGISLAFQIFSGCIVGYQLLTSAFSMGKHAERMLMYLNLQEFLLFTFAKQSGIIDLRHDPYLDYDTIAKWLADIESLLTDIDRLKKKYNLELITSPPEKNKSEKSPSNTNELGNSELNFLYRTDLFAERKRILDNTKHLKRVVHFPKKLWFAAVDEKGFKELIADLANYVKALNDLLDSSRQRMLQDSVNQTYAQVIASASKLDMIQNLLVVFLSMPGSEVAVALSKLKALNIVQSGLVNQAIKSPLEAMAISTVTPEQLQIPPEQITNEGGRSKYLALIGEEYVFVDWKIPNPEQATGVSKLSLLRQIRDLVDLLHIPKPEEFCTLVLRGYVDDLPKRWGYVYTLPRQVDLKFKCQSLHDLFHRTDYLPSLSGRIQLAEKLASALYLFHTGGWLHKGLSSHHVVFFTPSDTLSKDKTLTINMMEHLYIIGFDYSRKQVKSKESEKPPANPAEDIYRHPNAQYPASIKNPFKEIYDIYSLGVIFVELCYWRRMVSVLADEKLLGKRALDFKNSTTEDLTNIRELLLELITTDKLLLNVSFRSGERFFQVVQKCLAGNLAGSDGDYGGGLQNSFFEEIIVALKAIKI